MRLFVCYLTCLVLIPMAYAQAQCAPQWITTGIEAGTSMMVAREAVLWDPDGAGPKPECLVVAGPSSFGLRTEYGPLALWDGQHWTPFGAGLSTRRITAITVYRGEIIVGGEFRTIGGVPFNSIARWDGSQWQPMDEGFSKVNLGTPWVYALHVHNGELIAGGYFDGAGGVNIENIARWDGTAWQDMDGGMDSSVLDLETFGGELVAVGRFRQAGTASGGGVAIWDGQDWRMTTTQAQPNTVYTVIEHNGELHVGGNFSFTTVAGEYTRGVARFDGTEWQALAGLGASVSGLASYKNELVAIGSFLLTSGGRYISDCARWDGNTWQGDEMRISGTPYFVIEYDDELVIGGDFTKADIHLVRNLATWNGEQMLPLGDGFNYAPRKFLDTPFGFAANGPFTCINGEVSPHLALWNGEDWTASGITGQGYLDAVGMYQGKIVAAGQFPALGNGRHVAMWDGGAWVALGQAPIDGWFRDLVEFNGDLVVCGSFTTLGGFTANCIARWNGLSWEPMDTGFNSNVAGLRVYGGELIAYGQFTLASSRSALSIARWDGTKWVRMGSGFSKRVNSTYEHDGRLFAGGEFTNKIAEWNGISWDGLGVGLGDGSYQTVNAMATFEGSLVAAGYFRTANGAPTDDIAMWDGTSWSPLNGGAPERYSEIYSLGVHDNQLFVGGSFGWIGTEPSAYFARYGCPRCKADCDQSTGVGVLDIFDFLCFQNAFVNADPYACDCDISTGPATCDVFDFLCFQDAFVAGCP